MAKISRHNDIATGTCNSHKNPIPITGTIVASQNKVLCQGIPVAIVNDIIQFNCGHSGKITNGTSKSVIEGIVIAQIGSSVVGINGASLTATVTTGSDLVEEV